MQLEATDTSGPIGADGLLAADEVVPILAGWLAAGARASLVTLLASDGPGPRAVGAQMAVREDGCYAGYLSGGCLERSIVAEARAAMDEGRNRRVRFGGPDGYIDMTLPCGAALDLYVDQAITASEAEALVAAGTARRLASRVTDLADGTSRITVAADGTDSGDVSRLDGGRMLRLYRPPPRLVVLGSSPLVVALARLARHVGLALDVATPDAAMTATLTAYGVASATLAPGRVPATCRPDTWTATVVAFHEHESEPALLRELLAMPGFYVGALGSCAVHRRRVDELQRLGVTPEALQRLAGSIGSIAGAKTQAALAVGIVGDVLRAARDRGFID